MMGDHYYRGLYKQGRRCLKCLREVHVEHQMPFTSAFLRGICRKCWSDEVQREQEAADRKDGRLSSSESYEMSEVLPFGGWCGPAPLGLRSDARWYKKAGGNGDG